MIQGKRLKFRAIEPNDFQFMIDCRNNPEIITGFYEDEPLSLEMQKRWFANYLDRNAKGIEKMWIIETLGVPLQVGTTAITNIDWRNRKAEWERHLIDKAYWGRGYSQEAGAMLFNYVFEHMNMNKFYCEVFIDNPIWKTHQKFGFEIVGKLQQHIYKEGIYKDCYLLELLRETYFSFTKTFSKGYFE